ncbi:hypothetical protein A1O3_07154 [Capronia epimyces CBS 606.96]|uniref:Asteroid domain-containing protein n=1 Tax=Capronia epimyces CBS 606.96 TaxID=1182542 RepID=W9XL17_9EURO|nr:uncharacterized protein A1O3_07154 [Capronia epimyces CBS 606.96]EXJ80868.1 hypothetical protein A1O3_07154 [Capronia epimyces CBS 606.96]
MGIPRLSQDLQPYTECVVVGQRSQTTTTTSQAADTGTPTNVQCLIIDGPSLVYFVYNKLLAHKGLDSTTTAVPTYEEINQASCHLLQQLAGHGVHIRNIFFDGGLPEAKRDVRLGRMERLRQQLDAYRKTHADWLPITESVSISSSASARPAAVEKALWNPPVASSRKPILPAPPFMVASVIDCLRASPWKDRVQTVPGEADLFCALAAKESGAAILTNDSDLAVHDLGAEGRIVLLQSIEKGHVHVHDMATKNGDGDGDGDGDGHSSTDADADSDAAVITALALNPSHMAQRLAVSSLLRFGFERSIDPNLSVSLVRERARDDSRLAKYRAEYAVFAAEYQPPGEPEPLPALQALDPRTAELLVDTTDPPHVYLTPLVEDPSRDSSWSYGADVRQLAYSLLPICTSTSTSTSMGALRRHCFKTVVEYARKGQRIAPTRVTALGSPQALDRLHETLQLCDDCLPPSTDRTSILCWYMLAFRVIHQQKVDAGKTVPPSSQVAQLWGLAPSKSNSRSRSSSACISWDNVHLLANLHAVLYSFRMLQQITRHILSHYKQTAESGCRDTGNPEPHGNDTDKDKDKDDFITLLHQLSRRLDPMPDIQDLFLDIPHLRRRIGSLDLATRANTVVQLKRLLDSEDEAQASQNTTTTTTTNTTSTTATSASALKHDHYEDWTTTKPNKKKRKTVQQPKAGPGPSTRSANPFDLLMED